MTRCRETEGRTGRKTRGQYEASCMLKAESAFLIWSSDCKQQSVWFRSDRWPHLQTSPNKVVRWHKWSFSSHFYKLKPTHYLVDCIGKLSVTSNTTHITDCWLLAVGLTLVADPKRFHGLTVSWHKWYQPRHGLRCFLSSLYIHPFNCTASQVEVETLLTHHKQCFLTHQFKNADCISWNLPLDSDECLENSSVVSCTAHYGI